MTGHEECGRIRSRLPELARPGIDETLEREIREHLAACPGCRAAAVALDPSLLFLELRGQALPAPFWAGFQEGLRDRLEAEREARRFAWGDLFRYPRLAYLTAPAAMLLILGATLLIVRPGMHGVRPRTEQGGLRSPYAPPVRPGAAPAPPATAVPGLPGVGGDATPGAPPVIEEVGSPGARVYRFTVGAGPDETPIYLVVDESIDF